MRQVLKIVRQDNETFLTSFELNKVTDRQIVTILFVQWTMSKKHSYLFMFGNLTGASNNQEYIIFESNYI